MLFVVVASEESIMMTRRCLSFSFSRDGRNWYAAIVDTATSSPFTPVCIKSQSADVRTRDDATES
jgi:hypothetical protein